MSVATNEAPGTTGRRIAMAPGAPPPVIHHGTSLRALLRILHLDVLTPGMDDADEVGVFCSGDPEVARRYTDDQRHPCPPGGVISLDVRSLVACGTTVSPYVYHEGDGTQEWVISDPQGRDIAAIGRHVLGIDLLPNCIDDLRADPTCCLTDDEWVDGDQYFAAVRSFLERFDGSEAPPMQQDQAWRDSTRGTSLAETSHPDGTAQHGRSRFIGASR